MSEPLHKGGVGPFKCWLVGKMAWEVRYQDKVVATAENMNGAWNKAHYFNEQKKAGDPHGILAEITKGSK